MKIIIPLAGEGYRFIKAGFKDIKPLIDIDGKPMIQRVVEMFPKRSEFIFICNKNHLKDTPLKKNLKDIAPKGKIVGIDPHKLGPVHSLMEAFEHIDDTKEVFVNYVDLINRWDFEHFMKIVRQGKYDGALPAFRNFHPASLGDTFYAYMRINDRNELLEIREKASFTDNRMDEFASAGGYYFSRGEYLKKYCTELVEHNLNTSGEFYMSIPYNLCVRDGHRVLVYELPQHIVLGTPTDYHAYMFWADYFRGLSNGDQEGLDLGKMGATIIPIAGPTKSLFLDGSLVPKPLIPIRNKPLIIRTLNALPKTDKFLLLFLKEATEQFNFGYYIKKEFPKAEIVSLQNQTEGMACTCLKVEGMINQKEPLFISGYDFLLKYDIMKLKALIDDKSNDVIIFVHRDHHYTRLDPFTYSYLQIDDQDNVSFVSERAPISVTPYKDAAFAGALFFRTAKLFSEGANEMIRKGKRIQGMFNVATSVNELIEKGLKVVPFEVNRYIRLGTSTNIKEYKYWENYFSSCKDHPYNKEEGTVI